MAMAGSAGNGPGKPPDPTHVHEFRGELEGRGLEAQVAGGAGQDEAEVDVDDVAVGVQQDVPVVPAGNPRNPIRIP